MKSKITTLPGGLVINLKFCSAVSGVYDYSIKESFLKKGTEGYAFDVYITNLDTKLVWFKIKEEAEAFRNKVIAILKEE